jgi:hypothetical protein
LRLSGESTKTGEELFEENHSPGAMVTLAGGRKGGLRGRGVGSDERCLKRMEVFVNKVIKIMLKGVEFY